MPRQPFEQSLRQRIDRCWGSLSGGSGPQEGSTHPLDGNEVDDVVEPIADAARVQ
jgi:hypothetical protein